jgi:hypothetical protein
MNRGAKLKDQAASRKRQAACLLNLVKGSYNTSRPLWTDAKIGDMEVHSEAKAKLQHFKAMVDKMERQLTQADVLCKDYVPVKFLEKVRRFQIVIATEFERLDARKKANKPINKQQADPLTPASAPQLKNADLSGNLARRLPPLHHHTPHVS